MVFQFSFSERYFNIRKWLSWPIILLCLGTIASAEEVCKFEYLDLPEKLNGDTLIVPTRTVAMSEYVYVGDPGEIITTGNPCSIMLIVDVSQSNYADNTDHEGVRYEVIDIVLDSIYNRNSKVKVGMVYLDSELYFNPKNDVQIVEVSTGNYVGGYLKLLTLDETYSGTFVVADYTWGDLISSTPYTEEGRDVLKLYTQTREHTGIGGGRVPLYGPTFTVGPNGSNFPGSGKLTNLTASFDAAKDALNHSPHPKDKHFIIFFSDGGHCDNLFPEDYIQGINTPTTFTIYYNPAAPQHLENLRIMTENIKTNNYSSSNEKYTNLWNMAMDKDSLVNLIVKDIISEIITSLTTFISHDTITVNGLEGIKLVWDSTGFKFADLFPLKGKYTDFDYEIVYHIEKDSIINDGQDTIVVAEYDSTIYIDYTIEIDEGNSVSDSVKLTWWGRKLEFYHNGTLIASADESMDQLEVRFTEYEVDTLYGYKDVKVEITHVQGSSQDKENFTLTDNGSCFSHTFSRTLGNPNTGDNTLQHQKPDSIVAIFRNPKLPLDTLRVAIPFGGINPWPQIDNAAVYDQNGDGIGDSICITFDGSFTDSIDTKTGDFSWPQNQIDYSENIDESNQYNNNTIAFSYAPGSAAPVWTQGQSTITVRLDSLQTEILRSSDLNDGIGPLLTEASVIKRYVPDNDTFLVRITEPVNVSDIAGKSFILINSAQGKSIEIEPYGAVVDFGSETYIQFAITDLGTDAPAPGDSLKILHTGSVIDKVNNKAHEENTPVPIRFIDSNVPVENAYYYDINGDGVVDRVRAVFVDTVRNIDSITFDVAWTDINVSANDVDATYESNDKKAVLLDLQNAFNSSEIRDKTSGTMNLTLTYSATSSSVTYPVADKAAPVITKATYYLSKFSAGKRGDTDSLIVTFSENLNSIDSNKPFLLKTQQDIRYYLVLQKTDQSANEASFTVTGIEGVSSPVKGDSIWINERENVADNLGNPQTVEDNKRVELIIKTPPFKLDPYVIGPKEPWNNFVPVELQINGSSITRGTIIILEPDIFVPFNTLGNVACRIKIFDPVGNELASCNGYEDNNNLIAMTPLLSGPHNRIVILWAEKNLQNRDVGPGTYLGVIDIEYPDQRKVLKRVSIPVKE